MNIQFLALAAAEYRDAVDYYDAEVEGLGDEFREAVIEALHRIADYPHAWQKLSSRTRRCRTNRFPYGIVYQIRAEVILVVAVMHLKREPRYWSKRFPPA